MAIRKTVVVPNIQEKTVVIPIYGRSSYIPHQFSEKSRKQIEGAQQHLAKDKKGARNPKEEYEAAKYLLDGKDAALARQFKRAMVSACRYAEGLPMTVARGAFFVRGMTSKRTGDELIPLQFETERMRTDMVRLANGNADVRYRPEYIGWQCDLVIDYTENAIGMDQLVNLVKLAGYHVGVGDWRPERNGDFGRFEVDTGAMSDMTEKQVKAIIKASKKPPARKAS